LFGAGFFTVLLSAIGSPAVSACGFDTVEIFGSHEEEEITCDALEDVLQFFSDLGFTIVPTVEIYFKDRVFCDFQGQDPSRKSCSVQVSGLYDHTRKVVEITSANSPFRQNRTPWGIEWGAEISYSILQHELAHMAVGAILGAEFRNLSTPWHEFIAYAVQFELMTPSLLSRALESLPGATAFTSTQQVHSISHAMDPDAFAIRSFIYERDNGGGQLIVEILNRAALGEGMGDTEYLWTD
jgi:hypothetical protein